MIYKGGCHCQKIQFEFDGNQVLECIECNCSMCSKTGYLHIIIPKANFRLLTGADSLICYTWNTGVAQHLFCQFCGVKSFYVPRSYPEGYSVNARCVDPPPILSNITKFDGSNWEANINTIESLINSPP